MSAVERAAYYAGFEDGFLKQDHSARWNWSPEVTAQYNEGLNDGRCAGS